MSGVGDYSTTPGSNTTSEGILIGERMQRASVNNWMRAKLALDKKWWLDTGGAVATTGGALQPKRRAGLWRMSMSHTGGPGVSMTAEMCVDEASAGDFNFDPGKGSKDCASSKITPTGNGWAFESICNVEGRTVTTEGVITGDMSANYAMDLSTRMDPAPEGMGQSNTKMQAKWLGPCPAGMKPGQVKVAGMNFGG